MKKILIISMCLISGLVSAQDNTEKEYKGIVKFNPMKFLFHTFQVGYEQKTSPGSSFVINAGVCYLDNSKRYEEGYIGEFQYRYYMLRNETPGKNLLHHFYVAPYLNFKYFNIQDIFSYWGSPTITQVDKFNAYNFGLLTGINYVIAKRFQLDIYFGGGVRTSDSQYNNSNIMEHGFKGVAPKFGIDIGVNF